MIDTKTAIEAAPDPEAVSKHLQNAARDYDAIHYRAHQGTESSATDDDYVTGKAPATGIDVDFELLSKLDIIDNNVHYWARALADDTSTLPPSEYTGALILWLKYNVTHFLDDSDPATALEFADDAYRWATYLEPIASPLGTNLDLPVACAEIACDGMYRVWVNLTEPIPWHKALDEIRKKDAHCTKDKHHVMKVGLMRQVLDFERTGGVA